ncbi:MAG: recombination protein RecR [Alphaproteobacteria bacterium]|nr:recombination protein RecR [Alphaproteobacteria bacterium]
MLRAMTNPIESLIHLLTKLPGVGQRSARRMALTLLRHKESLMRPLAQALIAAADAVQPCEQCGNLDVRSPCSICVDPRRDPSLVCVVEDLSDLWAMERGHVFRGRYHVLGGTLSAIDGRGPEELNMNRLVERAKDEGIKEVILATNATVEGQTTAHYLTDLLKECNVTITRLAQGIPMGGELDYLDEGTLGAALKARLPF